MQNSMPTADEMRNHLTDMAVENPDFRRQLIADPKGVIHQEFGIDVPDNIEIKVHESDMRTVHLALPPDPVLDEEQLQAISAGLCCCGI
ncbi:MAG: NHLP leader peptide family RiPP precursor [Gammaproteobacteria bacterium]|nr:NHLP leader peptide family RiPP precursor [Gammaproteobacteria bacterium]MCY3989393.1 NHLP leader peptide family RiPP precursor [Gammaproteobacteria bacterium]